MTRSNYSFEVVEDCSCLGAPCVVLRRAAGMAFNFSAVPEKAPQPVQAMHSHLSAPRVTRQIFSRLDFFPAH